MSAAASAPTSTKVFSSTAANSINYALSATYAPQGALASFVNGQSGTFNGINLTMTYNARLQPSTIQASSMNGTVLDLSYGFNYGTTNNGNVVSAANNRNSNRSQTFTYDELNRIQTAQSQATSGADCWGLSYGYDIWANLLSATVTKCSAPMLSLSVSTQNRVTNAGFSYDLAGNLLADGSVQYTWDAESQMKTAAGVTYTYDGDGRRVQKSNGKLYWYGMGSDPLAESDLSGTMSDEYIFFGGRRIARRKVASGEINYYFADLLGSSRIVTSATGVILDDADFLLFGGERPVLSSSGNNYKFTGKERDPESGLDDFGARYYSSALGRFMSSDWSAVPVPVPYAELTNPQSLNLYAYVKNNPETLTDPDGHFVTANLVGAPREGPAGQIFTPPIGQRWVGSGLGNLYIIVNIEAEEQQQQAQQRINLLTVEQIGNIVFNETQSLSNSGKENVSLDQARDTIAHTIINTDVKYGADRDKIARTAPSTVSERAIKGNPAAYKSSQEAARQAYAESQRGVDPTGGSIRFNLRGNASRANFQKIQPIKTQSGPYNNSYPSGGLPGSGVYVNTYGPPE